MRGALGRLFAVAEAYPQLRASENFQALQEELSDTEDKIAAARRYYNNVVQRYNTSQQTFPTTLIAGALGFRPREFFELDDEADRAPVAVDLTSRDAPGADPREPEAHGGRAAGLRAADRRLRARSSAAPTAPAWPAWSASSRSATA